jgi:hypothetical protein
VKKNSKCRPTGQRILFQAHQYSLKPWLEIALKIFQHFSMFNAHPHLQIKLLQHNVSPFHANCIKSSDDTIIPSYLSPASISPSASLSGTHITPPHRAEARALPIRLHGMWKEHIL